MAKYVVVVQCGSQKCLNGGTCVENTHCECLDGYEGVLCGEGQFLKGQKKATASCHTPNRVYTK